ncbi:MAG: hypothetical protein A4E68_02386 [Syntrophaceae bacterium PtaB.Bin095]|nr:MAG: hypothetical protein A4E68_02386 [Syntrophaceae bacterium PtaB.Bin095]
MKVLAKPGAKCPMEHKPRAYITDSVPVDVPDSIYYRRLLADGSLIFAGAGAAVEPGGEK